MDAADRRRAIPDEYKGWTGSVTEEKTMPQLKKFVESGGSDRDNWKLHGHAQMLRICR